ncbi:MAG: DUF3563 family protein [Rubrivivax sp.]
MSRLADLIKALIPRIKTQEERDEAYLADAVDLYDLERRMREIDSRAWARSRDPQAAFVYP